MHGAIFATVITESLPCKNPPPPTPPLRSCSELQRKLNSKAVGSRQATQEMVKNLGSISRFRGGTQSFLAMHSSLAVNSVHTNSVYCIHFKILKLKRLYKIHYLLYSKAHHNTMPSNL